MAAQTFHTGPGSGRSEAARASYVTDSGTMLTYILGTENRFSFFRDGRDTRRCKSSQVAVVDGYWLLTNRNREQNAETVCNVPCALHCQQTTTSEPV